MAALLLLDFFSGLDGVQMMAPFHLQSFTSLAPVELLFGGLAFSLVVWPALWRRKRVSGSPVVEALLQRVQELRELRFPARYAHSKKVKMRSKLLAVARERIKLEKEFLRQRS